MSDNEIPNELDSQATKAVAAQGVQPAPVNPWAEIAVDLASEEGGIWIEDFMAPGWRLRIRSADSVVAMKVAARQNKAQRNIIVSNNGILPPAVAKKNQTELAIALIADWSGIPHPDTGLAMPFSQANAELLCGDERLKAFRNNVLWSANQSALFTQAVAAAMVGN